MLVGLGVLIAWLGLFFLHGSIIPAGWQREPGTIVDSTKTAGNLQRPASYTYAVEYQVNGRSYSVESQRGSFVRHQAGDTLEVAFNPANPSEAKVIAENWDKRAWYVAVVLGALGILMGIYGYARYLIKGY